MYVDFKKAIFYYLMIVEQLYQWNYHNICNLVLDMYNFLHEFIVLMDCILLSTIM